MIFALSEHASREREERLLYILLNVGIGENIVCKVKGQKKDRKEALTDSGVVLIMSTDEKIITAYIATLDKATAIWREVYGDTRMPTKLYEQILSNRKKYKEQLKVDNLYGYHIENGQYKFTKNRK